MKPGRFLRAASSSGLAPISLQSSAGAPISSQPMSFHHYWPGRSHNRISCLDLASLLCSPRFLQCIEPWQSSPCLCAGQPTHDLLPKLRAGQLVHRIGERLHYFFVNQLLLAISFFLRPLPARLQKCTDVFLLLGRRFCPAVQHLHLSGTRVSLLLWRWHEWLAVFVGNQVRRYPSGLVDGKEALRRFDGREVFSFETFGLVLVVLGLRFVDVLPVRYFSLQLGLGEFVVTLLVRQHRQPIHVLLVRLQHLHRGFFVLGFLLSHAFQCCRTGFADCPAGPGSGLRSRGEHVQPEGKLRPILLFSRETP